MHGSYFANMASASLVVFVCHVSEDKDLTNIFETIDHVGISRSCTKHNFLVKKIDDLSRTMREALHLSVTGRPGTILVDISKEALDDSANFKFPSIDNISAVSYTHLTLPTILLV